MPVDPTLIPTVRVDLPPDVPSTVTEDAENAAIAAVTDALSRFAQPPYGDLQCSAGRAAVVAIAAAAPILLAAGAVDALRDMADRIDRGPTFPMPPSVISALVRERADDIAEGVRRG